MEKSAIRFASDGDPSLLVLSVPAEFSATEEASQAFAIPLLSRRGGLLLAVPLAVFDPEKLVDELARNEPGLLGPSKSFFSDLTYLDDSGEIVNSGVNGRFMAIDFDDAVCPLLREYFSEEDDQLDIVAFSSEYPSCLPSMEGLLDKVREWASGDDVGRVHFYSAREEPDRPKTPASKKTAAPKRVSNANVMEQLSALAAQVQLLAAQQQGALPQETVVPNGAGPAGEPTGGAPTVVAQLPRVSDGLGIVDPKAPPLGLLQKAMTLAGPPPRTTGAKASASKAPLVEEPKNWRSPDPAATDPLLYAISQQGSALTALVAHLTNGGDAFADLSLQGGLSSSQSSATRGVQRREKMQGELAAGTSQYFMQMMQQMHRRMYPSKQVPKTEEDLKGSGLSMLQYLERFGGFKNQRDSGLSLWLLGYVVDAMIQGNTQRAQEHLALAIVAMEQASLDGDWNLAYLVSLAEGPPTQVFQERTVTLHNQGRPFSPLVPSPWAAVSLSYLKELEVLSAKKAETSKPTKKDGAGGAAPSNPDAPSPKRRPRYPKKPKASAAQDA